MAKQSQEGTVHITARVPVELARAFERLASAEDRSVSAELRRVMRRHVEGASTRPEARARQRLAGAQ
jgi:hypothetical protein